MDKKGKIFGKINIIDLAAVIIVILAIIGISIRFTSIASEEVKSKSQFSYKVEIDGVRFYTVSALLNKGKVTDESENVIGEIVNVEYDQKVEKTILDSGKTIDVVVPERYTVFVTIEAEGKESNIDYFVGENTELSVGSSIVMHTKYANCSGKIVDVQKIENQGQ